MTENGKHTVFDGFMVCTKDGAYMINPRTGDALMHIVCNDVKDTVPNNLESVGKIEPHVNDTEIPPSQSLDMIRINTNRNVGTNIRSFLSDRKIPQDHTCNWTPMESLAGMLTDYSTDKDVLETLDEIRDRFRE